MDFSSCVYGRFSKIQSLLWQSAKKVNVILHSYGVITIFDFVITTIVMLRYNYDCNYAASQLRCSIISLYNAVYVFAIFSCLCR